jgi:hypothetical protein
MLNYQRVWILWGSDRGKQWDFNREKFQKFIGTKKINGEFTDFTHARPITWDWPIQPWKFISETTAAFPEVP